MLHLKLSSMPCSGISSLYAIGATLVHQNHITHVKFPFSDLYLTSIHSDICRIVSTCTGSVFQIIFDLPLSNIPNVYTCTNSIFIYYCHRILVVCIRSEWCCECNHGYSYNGTICVAPAECLCADEHGVMRANGDIWPDVKYPDCVSHMCVTNKVQTINAAKDCAEIKCSLGEVPVKQPGKCCPECVPLEVETTTPAATTEKLCPR